jgi:alpha-1,2-mannosyltransferase
VLCYYASHRLNKPDGDNEKLIAKVVHDNLNTGGGSERLAIVTIELLNEMGFIVDIQTCSGLQIKELQRTFGNFDISIRHVKQLDMLSLLLNSNNNAVRNDDYDYDLIINTKADILPYSITTRNGRVVSNPDAKKTTIFSYCHYPWVPSHVKEREKYIAYLRQFIEINELKPDVINQLLSNALSLFDLMMLNSFVFTNSEFSKRAIKQIYGDKVEPTILPPPVDVEAFRNIALYSKEEERDDAILVVSRFGSEKQLQNAIEVAKILFNRKIHYKMIIVGRRSNQEPGYPEFLRNMIDDYKLVSYVTMEVDASFERLLHLMRRSKVYFHSMIGEPFGISVAEAMAAGLIPVVPSTGGNSEFVPQRYHYKTLKDAARIIENLLSRGLIKDNATLYKLRINLSDSVRKFSIKYYKRRLNKILRSY